MTEKDKVREMMRGRRMCSVCEIAKATGLDTEVIKPLMVELASEQIYTGTLKPGSYTSAEIGLIAKLYAEGKPYKDIAKALGRGMTGVCTKIRTMQYDGILPRRKQRTGDTKNA